MLNPTPGNPLVYEDCNGDKPQILRNIYTGNPLVYKDCNRKDERDTADRRDWQPTCLRGLQPRLTLCQKVALTTGNPLVYEDYNCKIFVICECYSTKDLLSYGGKCKKYLHGAKALNLIPITFYYRTNSP